MNDSMNAGAAGVQAGAEAGMSGGKGKDKAGILGKFLGKKPNGQQVPQQPSQNIGGYNPPPVQRNQAATPLKGLTGKGANNVSKATKALIPFSKRGTSICVTGFGGSGTSTIAYNLANIICQLGFTVLLVDLDVNGRTQNYIAKPCYEGMETDGANLRAAINSSTGISSQVSLVKVGFHLLTMGIVDFSVNHVFSAIWQNLSDSEKSIFSGDLRHYHIDQDEGHFLLLCNCYIRRR